MKLRHFVAALGVLATLAATATPSSAGVGVLAFAGNATTGPTWAPVGLCGAGGTPDVCTDGPHNWAFQSDIAAVGVHATAPGVVVAQVGPPAAIAGAGQFTGWCGHSTGTGRVDYLDGSGEWDNIQWISGGGTILLLGGTAVTGANSHAVVVAVIQARPTVGNCVTTPATNFLVAGVALAV